MPRQVITSFQNSKIKLANKLINKRHRERTGLFLIDDVRDLARALACGYQAEFVFYCEALATAADNVVLQRLADVPVYQLLPDLMKKAGYRQNPGGLIATMRQKPPRTVDDAAQVRSAILLGLVNLKKPGNIGALLRTADAVGISMIALIDSALDIYNPNIIRASTGAVFLDTIYTMTSDEALAFFVEHGITVIAAHLQGPLSLYDYDFTTGRTAIILGAEDTGLEDVWVNHCDALVKIPMIGRVSDSLNVSVAGALFLYEAFRQRQTT